jgi:hypothetical protein
MSTPINALWVLRAAVALKGIRKFAIALAICSRIKRAMVLIRGS